MSHKHDLKEARMLWFLAEFQRQWDEGRNEKMDMDEPVKDLTSQQIEQIKVDTLRWFEKLKSRVEAVRLSVECVEDWIESAAVEGLTKEGPVPIQDRPIGNRFVVRDNLIFKKSNNEVVPWDEPLFLFRARDLLALPALYFYKQACLDNGCNDYMLDLLDKAIEEFRAFQIQHPDRMKKPGVTKGR